MAVARSGPRLVQLGDEVPARYAAALFVQARPAVDPAAVLEPLRSAGYDGVVFWPRPGPTDPAPTPGAERAWREQCLAASDCVVVWVDGADPPDLLPLCYTDTGRDMVLGCPAGAPARSDLSAWSTRRGAAFAGSLPEALRRAAAVVGAGAARSGAECGIPLSIWRTAEFQRWYRAQRAAGNDLLGARPVWVHRHRHPPYSVFFWALRVDVAVVAEGRRKSNEVVVSRPDLVSVVLYRPGADPGSTDVVLVREFRSAGGFVLDLPGGSDLIDADLLRLARAEVAEETGLRLDPDRLVRHEARQAAATMSVHQVQLFSAQLTEAELDRLRSYRGIPLGVAEDTERTYVEVHRIGDLRRRADVDWTTLGLILQALADRATPAQHG